ncbi:PfkB family carbohydrate kinase [Alphaproteobacteria bacterium]|nr:PfkB family carbohydrate kinase [Alphaproteobacteria bacterium]
MYKDSNIDNVSGNRIGTLCFGHFNVIHPGHLRYLQFAADSGGLLGVLVKSDEMVRQQDGEGHFFKINERIDLLNSVPIKKEIFSTGPYSFVECIEKIMPQKLVLGHELQKSDDKIVREAAEYCRANEIELIFHSGHIGSIGWSEPGASISEQNSQTFRQFMSSCNRRDVKIKDLRVITDQFYKLSGLVLGDVIVDEFVSCEPLGVSSEAPVLVVREQSSDKFVGGAGIVAKHVASLGASCKFISVVGEDEAGTFVKDDLNAFGLQHCLITDANRPTTLKRRYVADTQKVFRVSNLDDNDVDIVIEQKILSAVEENIKNCDFIILSDFVYGVITQKVLSKVVKLARKNDVKLFGDLQCSSQIGNVLKFCDFDMIFPTEREARIALGNKDDSLEFLSRELLKKSNCKNLVIKLGKQGLIAYRCEDSGIVENEHFPALSNSAIDVAGAGDSLLAATSLSLCCGANIMEACAIGAMVASCSVERVGNVPVTKKQLEAVMVRLDNFDAGRS